MAKKFNHQLFNACTSGDFYAMEHLLCTGADPNALSPSGYAPLHQAIFRSKPECARLLLKHGAKPNTKTRHEGLSPAHFAIARPFFNEALNENHNIFLRLLLEAGADPCAVDRTRMSLACYSARTGCITSLKMLTQFGADIFSPDYSGSTPLILAAIHDRTNCLSYLLAAGADPNALQYDGHSSITLAIRHDNLKCLKLLVQAGARLDGASWKFSAMEVAGKYANTEMKEYVRAHYEAQKIDALIPTSNNTNLKTRL